MSVPVFPASSRAVTVIRFDPLERGMLADQEVVPVAVPLLPAPAALDQLTCVTPKGPVKLSDAVPPMLNDELLAVYVGLLVGIVIVTVGGVVSVGFMEA